MYVYIHMSMFADLFGPTFLCGRKQAHLNHPLSRDQDTEDRSQALRLSQPRAKDLQSENSQGKVTKMSGFYRILPDFADYIGYILFFFAGGWVRVKHHAIGFESESFRFMF